jgi:hypothetical protein
MQSQEIEDNIKSRRNKIFLLMEEVFSFANYVFHLSNSSYPFVALLRQHYEVLCMLLLSCLFPFPKTVTKDYEATLYDIILCHIWDNHFRRLGSPSSKYTRHFMVELPIIFTRTSSHY